MDKKIFIVGIYGPAGSGKSYIARRICELTNWMLIDGDELCHKTLNEQSVQSQLTDIFGDKIIHCGKINRKILGEMVFDQAIAMKHLEHIVWPEIEKKMMGIIKESRKNVIIDAAVLVKAGWDQLCDIKIYVDCKKEERLQYLIKKGMDSPRAIQLIEVQKDFEMQKQYADIIIENDRSKKDLENVIIKLISSWTQDKTNQEKAG